MERGVSTLHRQKRKFISSGSLALGGFAAYKNLE